MKTFFLTIIGFAGAAKLDTELKAEGRNKNKGCNKGGLLNLDPKYSLGVGSIESEGFGELKSEHGSQEC